MARAQLRIGTRVLRVPVGWVFLAATEKGLCMLHFQGNKISPGDLVAFLRRRCPAAVKDDSVGRTLLDTVAADLDAYFKRGVPVPTPPFDFLKGTSFQRKVWDALLRIPFGETRTYAEIAEEVGSPKGSRAVGGACGANPLALVIPCHRVIASDGSLGGYGGGLGIKEALLVIESGGAS